MAYKRAEKISSSNRWDTYNEKTDLERQIAAEADPTRKYLLEQRKKQQDEEQKKKMEELTAKASEMGLDPIDYYDKLKRGEIQDTTPQPEQQGGGLFSAMGDFIAKITGVTAAEQARNDAVKTAEVSQQGIADIYKKTQLLYANTTDPVEKAKLEKRLQSFEGDYGEAEKMKQEMLQPTWAENLVRHPLKTTWDAGTDLFFGGVKDYTTDLAEQHYFKKNIDELQQKIDSEQNPTQKKMLEEQMKYALENLPDALKKSNLQLGADATMAGIDVATLGLGGAIIRTGLKLTGKTLGKEVMEKSALKLLGEKGAQKLGLAAADDVAEKAIKESLATRIKAISETASTPAQFQKAVAKEVATSLKGVVGNKNTIEAVALGAGYGATGAVQAGETDWGKIAEEAAKGAALGFGLERGLTGALRGAKNIHSAEKDFSVKLDTLKKVDQKPSFRERVAMRKESYTPDAFKAYKEGQVRVPERVAETKAEAQKISDTRQAGYANEKSVSEAMKSAGVQTGKSEAIARLQDEKIKKLLPASTEKGVTVVKQEPRRVDYHQAFADLGVEDFNIQTARKNYVREMNKNIILAEKGNKEAVQRIGTLKQAWEDLKPHYTPKLADKVADKKLAAKIERIDTAKDIRTLKDAKKDLLVNEEKYIQQGMDKKSITEYDAKISTAIEKLKDKNASTAEVKDMSMKELERESRRLTGKEELKDADLKRLKEVNKQLFDMREKGIKAEEPKVENKKPVLSNREELQKKLKEAKTPEEKKSVHRQIRENIKRSLSESAKKKEIFDLPEPNKDELMALEKELDANPNTEYSMKLGGTMVMNRADFSMFKRAQKEGAKPYSFTQLAIDVEDVLGKAFEKLTGKKMEFRTGQLSRKDIKGEAKHIYNVARTEKREDFFTKVHEWAHFVTTKDAGFELDKVLSKEAQTEVLTWYKAMRPDAPTKIREAVAEGMAYIAANPTGAEYALERFVSDLGRNADKTILDALKDSHGLLGKLESLDPIEAIRGLQSEAVEMTKKQKFSEVVKGVISKITFAVDKTSPLYGVKFSADEVRKIRYYMFHGMPNVFIDPIVSKEGVIRDIFKLNPEYKSYGQLVAQWSEKLYKTKGFENMSISKTTEKMLQEVGDYIAAKHALERKSVIGIAAEKAGEIEKANKIIAEMETKSPWVKDMAKDVTGWWKDTTGAIKEVFADVLTPQQKLILEQKLGYEYYFPVIRRERGRVSMFRKAQGGTGVMFPVMENYVAKLESMMRDLSALKSKSQLYEASLSAAQRGENVLVEDITTQLSKEKKAEIRQHAQEMLGMTTEEFEQYYKNNRDKVAEVLNKAKEVSQFNPYLESGQMYIVVNGEEKFVQFRKDLAAMFDEKGSPYWSVFTASMVEKTGAIDRLIKQKFPDNQMAGKTVAAGLRMLSHAFVTPVRVARFGIINNPVFITNNLVRDFVEATKRSDAAMSAFTSAYLKDTTKRVLLTMDKITGGMNLFAKKSWAEDAKIIDAIWEASKMRESTQLESIGTGRTNGLSGAYSKRWLKGMNMEKIKYGLENAVSITESRARKTTLSIELNKLKNKGVNFSDLPVDDVMSIIQKANEISVDWSARGKASKFLKLAPFGRATATGTVADVNFFIQHPAQYVLRTAATVIVPTLAFYSLNNRSQEIREVWRSIPPTMKNTYWFVIWGKDNQGNPQVWKIAKPKSIGGTVGGNVEYAMDRFADVDPSRGYYFHSALFDTVWGGGSRTVTEGLGLDPTAYVNNPVVQSIVEQKTNKKMYWGTDVVSPYFQDKEKIAQQNEFTSIFAKELGAITNQSPMIIDNWLKNIGGSLGSQIVGGTAEAKGGGAKGAFKEVVGRSAFVMDAPVGYKSQQVKTFYEEFTKVDEKYNNHKAYSFADDVKLKKYYSSYNDTKQQLSDYFKSIRDLQDNKSLSTEEKNKKIQAVERKISDSVAKFNETNVRKEFLKTGIELKPKK